MLVLLLRVEFLVGKSVFSFGIGLFSEFIGFSLFWGCFWGGGFRFIFSFRDGVICFWVCRRGVGICLGRD